MQAIEATVMRFVSQALSSAPHPEILDATDLRADLGIGSLALMSLAFRIAEEFSLDVSAHADELADVATVGELCRFVRRHAQLSTGATRDG